MGNMDIALSFVVLINLLMWFSQIAMIEINPLGNVTYHAEGSIIGNSISNSNISNSSILDQLPDAQGSNVASGSGGFVTDLFNNILSWFKSIPGINFIINIASAPYNILNAMGAPPEFVLGIGTLWYMLTTFIV